MTWNEAQPAGNSAIKLGDNYIRELKVDVRSALSQEHESLADNPTTPTARHIFKGGITGAKPSAVAALRRIYFNSTKNQMEIENFGQVLPAGTPEIGAYACPVFPTGGTVAMTFYMTTPPVGWTQVTEATTIKIYDDSIMRVVQGTGQGRAGASIFSTCFSAQPTSNESTHTHDMKLHTHGYGNIDVSGAKAGNTLKSLADAGANIQHYHSIAHYNTETPNDNTSDAGTAHNHTVSAYSPKYSDFIVATFD
jgi:hypothetical protein